LATKLEEAEYRQLTNSASASLAFERHQNSSHLSPLSRRAILHRRQLVRQSTRAPCDKKNAAVLACKSSTLAALLAVTSKTKKFSSRNWIFLLNLKRFFPTSPS